MFIYVKIKENKLILFINTPIEKILVLFSDEEIREDFHIPRGNPKVRELMLAEFLDELENPRVFSSENNTRIFSIGYTSSSTILLQNMNKKTYEQLSVSYIK